MSGNNTIQSLLSTSASTSSAGNESQSQQAAQQPAQQNQQAQNHQGNPSTVQSHQNNNPNFNSDTGRDTGDNNSMQSLIERVMSGSQDNDGRPTSSSQQQQQSQPQQQQQQQGTGGNNDNNPGSQAQQIVSNFLRLNDIRTDFLNGIETDQLAERIGQGDISALTEALETTAGNAFQQAMATMVQMLPAFAEQIRSDVRHEFGTLSKRENNWTDFAKEYPELGRHEKTIRPVLEQAIKSAGGDVAQAQAAVAQIFAGLRNEVGDSNNSGGSNNRKNQQADSGFDLTSFLSAGSN